MKGSSGRRLGDRTATRMGAQMIDDAGCVTKIAIKDISPTGARIEIEFSARIPKRFILRAVRDRREFQAELVWRNGGEAGIRFVTEDAPLLKPTPAPTPAPVARLSMAELRKLAFSAKR
jgi:hypothetical protein